MLLRGIFLIAVLVLTPFGVSTAAEKKSVTVASFNIKWLGHYADKDVAPLVGLLQDMDIVLIQELVAPPYDGEYPDGTPYKPKAEARAFFELMKEAGFRYVLSEENTGRNSNRKNGTAAEWFVAFYKPAVVCAAGDVAGSDLCDASDLPNGFLSKKRAGHKEFDRVPYAFGFRVGEAKSDFVLISVHLRPDSGTENSRRRKGELAAAAKWVKEQSKTEKHFFVVGDMNIYNCDELEKVKPRGFVSLNSRCITTVTGRTPRPYDHVLFPEEHSDILHRGGRFKTIDLVEKMCAQWAEEGPCPGEPYLAAAFSKYYSDHRPIVFELAISADTD